MKLELVVGVCASLGMAPLPAWAEPHAEPKPEQFHARAGSVSLAALAGTSFGDGSGYGEGRRFRGSYGARLGYSFASTPLYLGVTLVRQTTDVREDWTLDEGTFDVELGSEHAAGPILVRPYLGLGVLVGIYSSDDGGNSALRPCLTPGVLARYPLGLVDIGVELRYQMIGSYPDALSALGSAGLAF
jgi:hypothetical protein